MKPWEMNKKDLKNELDLAPQLIEQIRMARKNRVVEQLQRFEYAACILFDPVHIRYATDASNMQVYTSRNPSRYCLITNTGHTVLFEFAGCEHLASGLETIDEIRNAKPVLYYYSGGQIEEVSKEWAKEIADILNNKTPGNKRIAIESTTPLLPSCLEQEGYEIFDAHPPLELARAIKVDGEMEMVRRSIWATEYATHQMKKQLKPGITENELWSYLHQAVIELGGQYIETRLLASGNRTNPWFQECSTRTIQEGELMAFDTDVVGCYGYYADFSRTFLCGDVEPSQQQRELYQMAHQQVNHNISVMRPGMSFKEYSEKAWKIPDDCYKNRYFVMTHGVGMTGEWPMIPHWGDFEKHGFNGHLEPGMTLCVESYIGPESANQGVKLEEQVLVTEEGIERISSYPYEQAFL